MISDYIFEIDIFSGNLDIQMVLEKLQSFAGKVHLLDLTHSDIR